MKKRILLAAGCLIAWICVCARDYMFRHLEVSNGLSNNSVYAIYKDKEGFMWFGTAAGLNRFDGYSFKVYRHQDNDPHSLPNNYITDIKEAPDGWMWIKTERAYTLFNKRAGTFVSDLSGFMNGLGSNSVMPMYVYVDNSGYTWLFVAGEGCYRFRKGEDTAFFPLYGNGLPVSGITAIGECGEGILLLYDNGLLACVDSSTMRLKWRKDDIPRGLPKGKYVKFSLFTDAEGCVWISSVLGLWVYDSVADRWREDLVGPWKNQNDFIHTVAQDAEGRIWIGKDYKGIDILDKKTGTITNLIHNEDDARSLSHNTVYQLYADCNGLMWAGTYKKGISYYGEGMFKFGMQALGDITCIEQEDEERLWLGTNNGELFLWNFRTGKMETHENDRTVFPNPVVALLKARDGRLWVGTFNGGLYCMDHGRMTRFTLASGHLSSDNIWTLAEDRDENIWIGYLDAGIQCLHPDNGVVETYKADNSDLSENMVTSLCFAGNHTLAIGTMGVSLMDMRDRKIRNLCAEGLISGESIVNQVYCDSRGWLWIATQDGLKLYDMQRHLLKEFPEITDGHDEIISAITEDHRHDMWISSTRQMIHLKVSSAGEADFVFESRVYNEKDGLQNCGFNQRSMKTLGNGMIVAGGLYGVNLFNPEEICYNNVLPKVLFSDLYLLDKEVEVGREYDGNMILPEELNGLRKIELDYRQNIFTIGLATDNFNQPENTRYVYRLDGFGSEWLNLPVGINRITFTNLSPKQYLLQVKAMNSDGYEGNEVSQLRIVIRPPFWMTWWAYTGYVALIVCILLLARRMILRHEREKYRLQQIEQESARKEEINQMKFRFFTNVSHELRTPLTLIISPLEELLKNTKDESQHTNLMLIYRNAHKLLLLVNQLLDFRKGEMSGHQLFLSEGEIVSYVREVCNSFLLMADKKHIRFPFFSAMEHFTMAFDADKIGKVMMNLLSNAFRFTPDGGCVTVMLEHIGGDNEYVEIKVSDTGIGIPDAEKEHIFDRFYQSERQGMEESSTGSGIGLSLVRDFVRLHEGSVEVFDNIGTGTVFVIHLPVKHVGVQAEQLGTATSSEEPEPAEEAVAEEARADFPLVMVVDDNADFRAFMRNSLELQYRVILSSNGNGAWETIQKESPDLVISDVMMPGMDGNELCRLIKCDKRTEHIPVILLTARHAVESRVEGLETGADDYVTKPFNMTVLMLRIRKFIELGRYRKSTQGVINPAPSDIVITSMDEKLIDRAVKYVESNISRTDLSVEELSHELGMSRAHLYKKMLQITGKTPIEFIRVIRLKRAAQLLRESQLHVSEIAYEVGFNNPKYFSRYFKEEFGILPSAYQGKGKITNRT